MLHRRAGWAAVAVTCSVTSGCFTTSADFREEAETLILENDDIAAGGAMVSATCSEPPNQDVGTVFSCVGVDENGVERRFDVEIAEADSIVVTEADLP